MTRGLVSAFLVVLGLVQLPFTILGVWIAVGFALGGPEYFSELHRAFAETGEPGSRAGAPAPSDAMIERVVGTQAGLEASWNLSTPLE